MSIVFQWIDLIYRVASGSWRVKLILAPLVGASFLGLIVAFVLNSRAVDAWLAFPSLVAHPLSLVVGSTLIAGGFCLMVVSMTCFLKARGIESPVRDLHLQRSWKALSI